MASLFCTDIRPLELGPLAWGISPTEKDSALRAVYEHAVNHGIAAIDWYLQARRPKKCLALTCRYGTILGLAAAGVFPMLAQIHNGNEPAWWAEPIAASIALAVAAGFMLLDRHGGFSNAWMRFIAAEHEIRALLHDFQMDWEEHRAAWSAEQPTCEQSQLMVDRCREFLCSVNEVIREDMNRWISEFRSSLSQLESILQKSSEKPQGLDGDASR